MFCVSSLFVYLCQREDEEDNDMFDGFAVVYCCCNSTGELYPEGGDHARLDGSEGAGPPIY